MKKLIVTAHPNPKGFTHRIAATYIATSTKEGHECFLMNLYDEQRKQDYLVLGEDNKPIDDDKKELIQAKITRADEIILVFPLRNFDAPAIMKNRYDVNFCSPFAFRFKAGSFMPHQFLKGKSARIFITSGAPTLVVRTVGFGIWLAWYLTRFKYVGIKLRSFTVFGKLPIATPEQREKMLLHVEKIAHRR